MSDKVREFNQYNQLKSKYIGLGNQDTTRDQFIARYKKDGLNAIVQHKPILNYNSIGLDQHIELTRLDLIKKIASSNN